MKIKLATVLALILTTTAFAQNPNGASAEHEAVTNTKPQARADAKVASKPAGKVRQGAGGDINLTPEGGAIGTDKAAIAGARRAESRDVRRPAKDGGVKRKPVQGGTPE